MTTREILTKAADYMEKHGKSRGRFQNRYGGVCAVGALAMALDAKWLSSNSPTGFWWKPEYMAALDKIRIVAGLTKQAVTEWSDANDKSTVIRVMRKAAELD